MMALDRTGKALADRRADHVDILARHEMLGRKLGADLEQGVLADAELGLHQNEAAEPMKFCAMIYFRGGLDRQWLDSCLSLCKYCLCAAGNLPKPDEREVHPLSAICKMGERVGERWCL